MVLTAVPGLNPSLELLNLGLLPQALTGIGLNPALVLVHVPADGNYEKLLIVLFKYSKLICIKIYFCVCWL